MSTRIFIDLPTYDAEKPAFMARRAAAAEVAGLSGLVVPNHPYQAIEIASYISQATKRIAIIAETDVVYTEPFHTAVQLQSLDHVSRGRAGWLVQADVAPEKARAVGREPVSQERLEQEVRDGIEVARRVWDSWEDDAEIRDVGSGRFIDADKIHFIEFEGDNYSIKGSSITPRSPQGSLPIFVPEKLADVTDDHEGVFTTVEVDYTKGVTAAQREEWVSIAGENTLIRIVPTDFERDLEELANVVLPHLRAEGINVAPEWEETLRDQLGLDRPASRYANADQN